MFSLSPAHSCPESNLHEGKVLSILFTAESLESRTYRAHSRKLTNMCWMKIRCLEELSVWNAITQGALCFYHCRKWNLTLPRDDSGWLWKRAPQIGTWTHMAGTQTRPKPMVFQLRSHPWFQDLMKLRFLMSHRGKNSVRDKVIGKEWTYLERNTLHRQSVGHLRRWERHQGMGLSVFIGVVSS